MAKEHFPYVSIVAVVAVVAVVVLLLSLRTTTKAPAVEVMEEGAEEGAAEALAGQAVKVTRPGTAISTTCTDPDKSDLRTAGKSSGLLAKDIKGVGKRGEAVTVTDSCLTVGGKKVLEWTCEKNALIPKSLDCPAEMICGGGKCEKAPAVPPKCTGTADQNAQFCVGDDAGLTVDTPIILGFSNICPNNDVKCQMKCKDGYAFQDNTCVYIPCTETDTSSDPELAGNNPFQKGSVDYVDGGYHVVQYDYCQPSTWPDADSAKWVMENRCVTTADGKSVYASSGYDCSQGGGICFAGACQNLALPQVEPGTVDIMLWDVSATNFPPGSTGLAAILTIKLKTVKGEYTGPVEVAVWYPATNYPEFGFFEVDYLQANYNPAYPDLADYSHSATKVFLKGVSANPFGIGIGIGVDPNDRISEAAEYQNNAGTFVPGEPFQRPDCGNGILDQYEDCGYCPVDCPT